MRGGESQELMSLVQILKENGKNIYIVSCSRCKSMKKSRAELFYVCFSYLYSAAKVCILYMAI